jgi:glycyl-tRNA synthetase beta chain
VWDKVERVRALAKELCAVTGADPKLVDQAAIHAKMDLVTETVGEFPELQGQVGRQLYALTKGNHESVAAAIEDHYRPLGPNDRVPSDRVAVTLALADKLDTLVGFWAIDEKPTGSSDPYALRRAALGVIRIVLEHKLRFFDEEEDDGDTSFLRRLGFWIEPHVVRRAESDPEFRRGLAVYASGEANGLRAQVVRGPDSSLAIAHSIELGSQLFDFLADRLKVQMRERGIGHDRIAAAMQEVVFGTVAIVDDLVLIVERAEALDAFLKTEDGANLLAGYKRAANILAAEEKKNKWSAEEAKGQVDAAKLAEPAEKTLYAALEKALPAARAAVEKEEFAAAMKALSGLRAPVDAFFDKVMVNADDAMLRRNRLLLLSRLREALSAVADFSKIEG